MGASVETGFGNYTCKHGPLSMPDDYYQFAHLNSEFTKNMHTRYLGAVKYKLSKSTPNLHGGKEKNCISVKSIEWKQ